MATIEQSEKVITVDVDEEKGTTSPVKRKSETSESTLETPVKKQLKSSVVEMEDEDSNQDAAATVKDDEEDSNPDVVLVAGVKPSEEAETDANANETGKEEGGDDVLTADEADGNENEGQEGDKEVDDEDTEADDEVARIVESAEEASN